LGELIIDAQWPIGHASKIGSAPIYRLKMVVIFIFSPLKFLCKLIIDAQWPIGHGG